MLKRGKEVLVLALMTALIVVPTGMPNKTQDIDKNTLIFEIRDISNYKTIDVNEIDFIEKIEENTYKNNNQTRHQETSREFSRGKEFAATAYCGCKKCNGKWYGYPTASGTDYVQGRTIAVDPKVIPLGTHVLIDGKEYIAEDTGSAIKGNKVDIYFDSHQAALNFGKKIVYIEVVR